MKTCLKPALAAFLALLFLMPLAPGLAQPLPPVEQQAPNADYPPAFPGQTRAPGMKTETPYKVEVLTDQLVAPWGIAALPDGRLLITEKRGSLRIYDSSTGLSAPIPGITGVSNKGQGGLLDVLLAPDFESSPPYLPHPVRPGRGPQPHRPGHSHPGPGRIRRHRL